MRKLILMLMALLVAIIVAGCDVRARSYNSGDVAWPEMVQGYCGYKYIEGVSHWPGPIYYDPAEGPWGSSYFEEALPFSPAHGRGYAYIINGGERLYLPTLQTFPPYGGWFFHLDPDGSQAAGYVYQPCGGSRQLAPASTAEPMGVSQE